MDVVTHIFFLLPGLASACWLPECMFASQFDVTHKAVLLCMCLHATALRTCIVKSWLFAVTLHKA